MTEAKCFANRAFVSIIVDPERISLKELARTLPTDIQRENTHGQTLPSVPTATTPSPHWPHSWSMFACLSRIPRPT
jgi:hypothetical protein